MAGIHANPISCFHPVWSRSWLRSAPLALFSFSLLFPLWSLQHRRHRHQSGNRHRDTTCTISYLASQVTPVETKAHPWLIGRSNRLVHRDQRASPGEAFLLHHRHRHKSGNGL
ncbi:hypothetical protein F5Y03DRAFT_219206 [Xylaria venustula]|nr:hypothetical protein F5Y03DRAFT_219206 [Xylaria venustula]